MISIALGVQPYLGRVFHASDGHGPTDRGTAGSDDRRGRSGRLGFRGRDYSSATRSIDLTDECVASGVIKELTFSNESCLLTINNKGMAPCKYLNSRYCRDMASALFTGGSRLQNHISV